MIYVVTQQHAIQVHWLGNAHFSLECGCGNDPVRLHVSEKASERITGNPAVIRPGRELALLTLDRETKKSRIARHENLPVK